MHRRVIKFRVNGGKLFFFFNGVFEQGYEQRNVNWIKGKDISFGNNCICKILEVEITQFCMKSLFVYSRDFVFRKAGFILFKWSYILKYLSDYSHWNFSSWQRKKKTYIRGYSDAFIHKFSI